MESSSEQDCGAPSRGFSLVELLVVIAVIGVLVALLLPVLGKTWWAGKGTRQALSQRQTYMALTHYVEDFRDTFPYYATPGEPLGPLIFNGHRYESGSYFQTQARLWATALVPNYIPQRDLIESADTGQHLIETGRDYIVAADAWITDTVFADPKFFTADAQQIPLDYSHFRATHMREALYPSNKVLLVPWSMGPDDLGLPCTFVDGSTKVYSEQAVNRMPSVEVRFIGDIPIRTTPNGLAGRDD